MTSTFESIFTNSSAPADPNLSALFSRKAEAPKAKKLKEKNKLKSANEKILKEFDKEIKQSESGLANTDDEEGSLDGDDELVDQTARKFKKLDKETEERTVFVGNLNCDCKKEVISLFSFLGAVAFHKSSLHKALYLINNYLNILIDKSLIHKVSFHKNYSPIFELIHSIYFLLYFLFLYIQ